MIASHPTGSSHGPSQDDQTPIVLPSTSPNREVRIDFFRGMALLVMVLDHNESILNHPLLSRITYAPIGITSAAAVFIGLSGMTVGYALLPTYQRCGFWMTQFRCMVRSWRLYLLHLVALVLCVAEVKLLSQYLAGSNSAAPLIRVDQAFLARYATLQTGIGFLDILPLYIVLMLAAPIVLALALRSPFTAWCGSFALYAWVQYARWNGGSVSLPFAQASYFEPLAWQFLFATGIILGVGWRLGWLRVRLTRWQLGAILIALVAMGVWYKGVRVLSVMGWSSQTWQDGDSVPYDMPGIDKTTLGPLRYLHFFLACAVVAHFVPATASWLKSRWSRLVILCGQQSLEVYVFGVVLNYACYAASSSIRGSWLAVLGLDAAAILLSVLCAALVSYVRQNPWKAATRAAPVRHPTPSPHRPHPVAHQSEAAAPSMELLEHAGPRSPVH